MQGREAGPDPRAAACGEHGEDPPLAFGRVEVIPGRKKAGSETGIIPLFLVSGAKMNFFFDNYKTIASLALLLVLGLFGLIAAKYFGPYNKIQRDIHFIAKIFLVVATSFSLVVPLAYLDVLYEFAKKFENEDGTVFYRSEPIADKALNGLLKAVIDWYPIFDKSVGLILVVLFILVIFGAFGHYFGKDD